MSGEVDNSNWSTEIREQRKLEAFQLRAQGFSFRSIAAKLSVSLGEAHKLTKECLTEVITDRKLITEEWRTLELEACDEMLDQLASHTMRKFTPKKPIPGDASQEVEPVFRPNISVMNEIRQWREYRAELLGLKTAEIALSVNVTEVAKKIFSGIQLMNAATAGNSTVDAPMDTNS